MAGARGHVVGIIGSLHDYRLIVLFVVVPAVIFVVEVLRRQVVDRARHALDPKPIKGAAAAQ